MEAGCWLAANLATGRIRPMEHEGDYADDDVLVHVTVEDGRVWARLHERSDKEESDD